ncbi:MAG: hypothetical protein WEE89_00770 [Gemmatimonadota bacterium]
MTYRLRVTELFAMRVVCNVALQGGTESLISDELHRVLVPEDFSSLVYRQVWRAICAVRATGRVVTPAAVVAHLDIVNPGLFGDWVKALSHDEDVAHSLAETGVLEFARELLRHTELRRAAA